MTPPTALEDRIRRGLHAAADALPEAPLDPPASGGAQPPRAGRSATRRWVPRAAAVAAIALGAGALLTFTSPDRNDDGDGADVHTATPGRAEQPQVEARKPNGRVPGRAVLVNREGDGASEIRTYGPDGTPTGTVDLAPMSWVQAATSDLDGGWVATGHVPRQDPPPELPGDSWNDVAQHPDEAQAALDEAEGATAEETGDPATTSTIHVDLGDVERNGEVFYPPTVPGVMWFPADGEPVALDPAMGPLSMADSMQVVDSPEGPTLLYPTLAGDEPRLRALVLETGEDRELPARAPTSPTLGYVTRWSATAGRVVLTTETGGLRLVDLATGADLPVAAIDVSGASDVAISHDATSVAVIHDQDGAGSSDVVVYDLATGAERFRETAAMGLEGAQLSYDGTTLAFGGHDQDGVDVTVTVVDLATGARHTLDAHGLVL
jgi:hypothetical protein